MENKTKKSDKWLRCNCDPYVTPAYYNSRYKKISAHAWQNQQYGMCPQWRLRSAWASVQSDQSSLSAWRKLGSFLISTHNICFRGEIRKIYTRYHLLSSSMRGDDFSLYEIEHLKTRPARTFFYFNQNTLVFFLFVYENSLRQFQCVLHGIIRKKLSNSPIQLGAKIFIICHKYFYKIPILSMQKMHCTGQTSQVYRLARSLVSYVKIIALGKMLFFNSKVWIFFLFLHENICCGYSLEAPRWGASNEYPQHVFMEK